MLRSGDVQHERHAVDAAARDVGRAMDDARVVEEAVAMARLAAPLEERHVVVAQGARTLRVRALAAERRARRLRGTHCVHGPREVVTSRKETLSWLGLG